MSNSFYAVFVISCALVLLGAIIWASDRVQGRLDSMRVEAIELGYARHNPVSGDWEWIKPELGE